MLYRSARTALVVRNGSYGCVLLLKRRQGEPPAKPDLMQSVHILADLPATERPKVSVMTGAALKKIIDQKRLEKGADFSLCDVVVPAKAQ